MESPYTRGPWRVDETVALGAYGVWTDYATHPGHDGAGYPSQVCSLLPGQSEISREERDANARLVAAAPALALAWSMLPPGTADGMLDRLDSDPATHWAADAIRAALGQ